MKQLSRDIAKDRSGIVRLVPEEQEDMWHAFNLIAKDDTLKCTTIRRVVSESSTGSTDKSSVRINLTIRVESVEYDVQACVLRVNGRNIEENKFVKMGGYHTLDLELNRPFSLGKQEWDVIALERIDTAIDVTAKADVGAIVMEEGLANIVLVTNNMSLVRQRIEVTVPRKRIGSSSHDKALVKFFDHIYNAMLKHFDFNIVKVLIIASPGFYREQMLAHIKATATRTDNKVIMAALQKILLVHCSSGQKHALGEALQDPGVQAKLSDTKFAVEVKALDRFYAMLSSDPNRAFYGYRHVRLAASKLAIDTLLVTDELFRAADIQTRRKYIALVESVREMNGTVLVFSSLHTSGEQLNQLTGVACILNYPLPELEDEAEEEERLEKGTPALEDNI